MREPEPIPQQGDDESDGEIDWHRYLRADPNVIGGKPVAKGTRLGVEGTFVTVHHGPARRRPLP